MLNKFLLNVNDEMIRQIAFIVKNTVIRPGTR
jgi:hypothetical protein